MRSNEDSAHERVTISDCVVNFDARALVTRNVETAQRRPRMHFPGCQDRSTQH